MGYMRHRAIVVTCFDTAKLALAHTRAREVLGDLVSPVVESIINGYVSFFVAPDGSKLGWKDSDCAEHARDNFVAWLDAQRYEDGSSPFDWVEVQYGDDERETIIVRDDDHRPDEDRFAEGK